MAPEKLPVASETPPVAFETLPVASETLPMASETLPVASETLPVGSETLSRRAILINFALHILGSFLASSCSILTKFCCNNIYIKFAKQP